MTVPRLAHPADASACAAILNAWIDATPWMPRIHPPEDVTRHYRKTVFPTCRVWVTGSPVSGFLALDEGHGLITALCLEASACGRGLGRALLDAAKGAARRLALWTFQANEGAQRFYMANGFRETARTNGDNEEGLPDIRYEWAAG